jgi:chromosome segregation protein
VLDENMQLSNIKITGFKSFVDPTLLALPGHLVAIVGPNGCGKSNIIDAVTWVMGESSPKYLRGESLTDVIFNGSTARKPVGQASVELIFDNSDGSIGGEYANFSEVSVKRLINRDSESIYFLNGVRCRKKDAVSLFLGTGLGPRSYSIIGQNMINKAIEAKPDELRTYLEEAAGISKYKERRHETELRIQHTKENMARVNDVRAELENQLSHLKQQANIAEKFKTLKQQERVARAELLAMQWRQIDRYMVDHTLKIQREETAFEARKSELTNTEKDIEQTRHEQRVAQEVFQEIQRRYYAAGNEITRIEQDILHHQERQKQWEDDLKQTEQDWQIVKDQMTENDDQLHEIERDVQTLQPQFTAASEEIDRLQTENYAAEEEMQSWQNTWDDFNQTSAKSMQVSQVEKIHIQHLEQKISELQKRQQQLLQDESQLNFTELNQELDELSKKTYQVTDKLAAQNEELQIVDKEIKESEAAQQDAHTHLDELRSELQRALGQHASLDALQKTALGQRDNPTHDWIVAQHLEDKPRLGQGITVEKEWEFAVEKVLGFCLKGICIDDLQEILPNINDFKSGNLCVVMPEDNTTIPAQQSTDKQLLVNKIQSKWALSSLLAGIYTAENLQEALGLCQSLAANESVVTKDGVWLNRSWLQIFRDDDPTAGVFQREQELKKLTETIEHLQMAQKELEKNIELRLNNLQKAKQRRDELQRIYTHEQAQSAQVHAQLKSKQERLTEIKILAERLIKDTEETTKQLQHTQTELSQARLVWENAMHELEHQAIERERLTTNRDHLRQQLQQSRVNLQEKRQRVHELEMRLQTAKSQKSGLQQNNANSQTQLTSLAERKITLQSELSSIPPMETLKKSLSRTLDKHVNIEMELNTARVGFESLEQELRNLEEKRHIIDNDINKIRNILESLRLEWQSWKVKLDTLVEQMKETEFTLEAVLQNLSAESTVDDYQKNLDQLLARINRLGPINLVAIDEYATCLERKQYLDAQIEDLQSGLNTLEDAIAKIDKETRAKFKETFDQVNQRFQELFPTIFGGGKAYLELTNDNLLEAGVTMMACPPGKRNSSIYLLSGGEKSLTAIAFIFSIFYLNPAPFCMLDEVDAALDDANVGRFTHLVKSMSDKTQFIFISHNKMTIEMAENLIGVTMNEPGVSRLVSVDIEKAMSLAGA